MLTNSSFRRSPTVAKTWPQPGSWPDQGRHESGVKHFTFYKTWWPVVKTCCCLLWWRKECLCSVIPFGGNLYIWHVSKDIYLIGFFVPFLTLLNIAYMSGWRRGTMSTSPAASTPTPRLGRSPGDTMWVLLLIILISIHQNQPVHRWPLAILWQIYIWIFFPFF